MGEGYSASMETSGVEDSKLGDLIDWEARRWRRGWIVGKWAGVGVEGQEGAREEKQRRLAIPK